MRSLRVVHLVDDTTAGGVMRVLDHLLTAPELSLDADHSLRVVDRKTLLTGPVKADVIVSHLAISWRILPMLLSLRARHSRTALIHVEHSYTEGFVAANVTRHRRFSLLLRITYRLFNRVVAVSHAQGQWLERSGAVRASALTVIQSCVDLAAFRAVDPVVAPIRVIGAIGRLNRQKGFDTLIKAFRRTTRPDITLHIYGEGAEEQALRRAAEGDPRIRFMGFVADPIAAIEAVDAVAMPSIWEAYGLVAIEAMSAGRQLLVNKVDGLVDHVAHGAIPVGDGSVDAWHREISNLVDGRTAQDPVTYQQSLRWEHMFALKWRSVLSPYRATF